MSKRIFNHFQTFMQQFTGVDYINIQSLLSEEEIMIRDTVREFVSDQIIPIIEKYNREGKFPIQLVPKMAELGILGTTFPANRETETEFTTLQGSRP